MEKRLFFLIAINSAWYFFSANILTYCADSTPINLYDGIHLSNDLYLKALEQEVANYLHININQLQNNAESTTKIQNIINDLEITNVSRIIKTSVQNLALCKLCHDIVRRIQTNAITVQKVGIAICNLYITLSTWTTSTFCEDIVRINLPVLQYVLEQSELLSPEYACSVLLQNQNCYYSFPALKWRIDIPARNNRSLVPNNLPNDSLAPLKILHLTDVHISQDYEIGGISNCGYPICCKSNLGSELRRKDAGKWGHYDCDSPPWMFLETLDYINSTHKDIDLIIFTGDIIDHTIWKDSKLNNINGIKFVFDAIAEIFPNLPVLPILGNHDSSPVNMFAPPEITDENLSQKWLYDLVVNLWSKWLPTESLNTIQKQGYYSIVVNRKLRVIALNNNVCYVNNWWLLYKTDFLKEQLEFLRNELLEAENSGQQVYIIGHVYPGEHECIEPWEVNYNNLVTRFSHIIKCQLFGHSHTDSYKVFFSKENGRPINVAFNGASLTPYMKYNPNYKILSVEPNTFDILDIDTYYFNLTEANLRLDQIPNWQKLYSMKGAYAFKELSPESFYNLSKQLSVDANLFQMYRRFYARDGDPALKEKCSASCRENLISNTLKVESLDYR